MRFEYDDLVQMFENALLTELRGHGASGDFLKLWVPDPDVTKSLINMADAAGLENVAGFEVGLSAPSRAALNTADLTAALAGQYDVAVTGPGDGAVITFTQAGST